MLLLGNGCRKKRSYVSLKEKGFVRYSCLSTMIMQLKITGHPNVRVFLTHGGLLGITEATYCGVAFVVTPLGADQYLNAAAIEDRGIGSTVSYNDFTAEKIKEAIEKVLQPEIQENIREVSYAFKNRPKPPLETAIWWVEHVAKTKGARLTKSQSTYLPRYAYHCIDIYAFIFTILFLVLTILVCSIKMCCRYCCCCRRQTKSQDKVV